MGPPANHSGPSYHGAISSSSSYKRMVHQSFSQLLFSLIQRERKRWAWKLFSQTLASEAVAAANQFPFVFLLLSTLSFPQSPEVISVFLVIYLHISLQNFIISLFGVMSVQGRRALFMKLVWMGRKLLSRNPSCLLLKTLINSTRSCNSYGLHFYPSVFSFLWIYVQNLNGFIWNFKYDNIDNAAS